MFAVLQTAVTSLSLTSTWNWNLVLVSPEQCPNLGSGPCSVETEPVIMAKVKFLSWKRYYSIYNVYYAQKAVSQCTVAYMLCACYPDVRHFKKHLFL